jgi:hypothetical protein
VASGARVVNRHLDGDFINETCGGGQTHLRNAYNHLMIGKIVPKVKQFAGDATQSAIEF